MEGTILQKRMIGMLIFIEKKIVNNDGLQMPTNSEDKMTIHTTAAYSDHDPILLTTEPIGLHHHQKSKLHRFKEKWVAHPECEDQIRTSWTQSQPTGSSMFCLFEKIKRCRMDLVA